MTVLNDITPAVASAKPPIVAKRPPKYLVGDFVVLRGYEDGWHWLIIDAEVLRRKAPFWSYTVICVRPYDGKTVKCAWPEWRLRPVPGEA